MQPRVHLIVIDYHFWHREIPTMNLVRKLRLRVCQIIKHITSTTFTNLCISINFCCAMLNLMELGLIVVPQFMFTHVPYGIVLAYLLTYICHICQDCCI